MISNSLSRAILAQSKRVFGVRADDLSKRSNEKFELMSAYLDNEASEQEQALVEDWLANDPQLLGS